MAEIGGLKGAGKLPGFVGNIPLPGTPEYETYRRQQEGRFLNPQFAQQVASMAKAYPNASAGVVLGLTKAGATPYGQTATAAATMDGQAFVDQQREAAKAAAAKLKEQNKVAKGSPADFLAPLTRTAFMLLSTPFEMLEASIRNTVAGRPLSNTFDETQTGQALAQLFKDGRIDVGTGFLSADPNSAVGKALLQAKIAAGPQMKGGVPWTYSTGLTQALFDDPETKAARTFQAVSGFILNLGLDPLTYVPGVGLLKIGKEAGKVGVTLRIGPKAAARAAEAKKAPIKAVIREAEDMAEELAKVRAGGKAASGNLKMLEGDLIKLQDDYQALLPELSRNRDLVYSAKWENDLLDATYGELATKRSDLFTALKSETTRSEQLVGDKRKAEELIAFRLELNNAGRAAEVQGVLDKGFDVVAESAQTLARQETLAPGLIHTLEEAALKKGARTATQGIRAGADVVVRVAAKQKPKLIKWTALVKAGDSPQATRVGNEIGSNLIDVGTAAGIQESKLQGVLDVIDTPGATHAELVSAAQRAGIVDSLYLAYERSGIQGFENVGATRGVGGGGYAYFPRAVDPFDAKLSDFARLQADAIASPDVRDFGLQAPTTRTGITQQVEGLTQAAAAPRLTVQQQIAALDEDLAEVTKVKVLLDDEYAKANKAYTDNLKMVEDRIVQQKALLEQITQTKGAERLALEAEFGLLNIGEKSIINYQQAAKAFFGPLGQNVAKMVAVHYGPEDYYDVWRAFNGDLSVDTAKRLAAATSEKEVIQILAREAGLDISTGTRLGLASTSRALEFKSGIFAPNSLKLHHAAFEKFFLDASAKGYKAIKESPLGRFSPTKNLIHLDDVDELVKQMNDTLPFLKASPKLQQDSVKAMMAATTSTERFNIFIDTIKALVKEKSPNLTEEQVKLLDDAARVFKKEQDANRRFLAQVDGNTASGAEHIIDGQKLKLSSLDPLLDSQLSNFVKWPDIDSFRQLTGKTRFLSRNASAQQFRAVSTDLLDSFFKQTVLVYRVSYVIRNIGDMQVRAYLGGSSTLFNHPLQFIGMMLGNPAGSRSKKFLSQFSRYDTNVFGTRFDELVKDVDVSSFKGALLSDADQFAAMMTRGIGMGVGQGTMSLSQALRTGMRFIDSTEKGFNRAWAGAILQYRESSLARLAAGGLGGYLRQPGGKPKYWFSEYPEFLAKKQAQGFDLSRDYDKMIVDFMFETKQGRLLREQIAKVDETNRALMLSADESIAKQAMAAYFSTVSKGIDNLSAGRAEIRDFIAGKQLRDVAGDVQKFDPKGTTSKDVWLGRVLKDYRQTTDVSSAIGQLKLPADDIRAVASLRGQWDRGANLFFRLSAQLEKRGALGPEFQQQYWNGVADNFNLLSKADAEDILLVAEKELRNIKVFGVKAGTTNPALVRMREAIKTLDDRGLAKADIDAVGQRYAADQVRKLYYDATRQKQYAAQFRLVAPFIQAWANTLGVWGKLITKDVGNTFRLQGKARTYKGANAFEYLTTPETGVLYEWMGDNWNDPSQGFIYKDPTYGDPRLVMPLAGNILGAMLGTVTGEKVPGMPVSLSIPSLNLAFSNELLPGVGPAIQLSLGRYIKNQNGWIADQLRDIIYPFGAPEGKMGVVETFTPAWASRILYGLGMDSYEAKNVSTLRPLMAYLASTGEYGDFPLDGQAQAALLEDAGRVNRVLALWRGITQNLSPGAISPQILAKDKTGEFHVQALMFNDFVQIRANNPDSYELAVAKWAEKYGYNSLFALVSGTRGGITPTDDAWKFYSNNRDDANQFPNAFALFFPGGQYSQEFAKWQEQRGQRFRLSPAEMQLEAARYVYTARKAKLQQDMTTAVGQGADPKMANQVYLTLKSALDDEFGGQPDFRAAGVPRETLVKEVTAALDNPKFAEPETGKGLAKFLLYRDAALQSAAAGGFKSLTAKSVANVADWLNQSAYQIIAEHPEFSVMYWRVFATETGNN
jgi:hypothetical protein